MLIYRNMGVGLVFENSLVYPPGQNISKSSFFNHIWTHLPGVNGFLLEPFMTCNVISRSLCVATTHIHMQCGCVGSNLRSGPDKRCRVFSSVWDRKSFSKIGNCRAFLEIWPEFFFTVKSPSSQKE